MNEFELIERLFAPLASGKAFGFRDDAALLEAVPGHDQVITQDSIAEGVHFLPGDPPFTIAQKAARVNLSDLAAKGATPHTISLSLGIGPAVDETWLKAFAAGLASDCDHYEISLTGGDTFRAPGGTVVSVTAIGHVPHGQYRSRLAARPGDVLYVTGTIGKAALGLRERIKMVERNIAELSALDPETAVLVEAYLVPEPAVSFAAVIAEFATGSMDLSDGFAFDGNKLCAASGINVRVPIANVPFAEAVSGDISEGNEALQLALNGGDDYQILFATRPEDCGIVEQRAADEGVRLTRLAIAETGENGFSLIDEKGEIFVPRYSGHDHFGGGS